MEKELQKKQTENIYNLIRNVVKNWLVIVCAALSVALLSYVAAALTYHPTYTSSTTFVVSAKENMTGAYANLSTTQKLTDTFKSVMDSTVLKKKVAQTLEMDSFEGTISITVVPETNLLTVSVKSASPDLAFKLLNGLLDNYEMVSQNVLGEVVLEVFEEPNFPFGADRSFNGRSVMKKTFVLAMAAMIAVFAVLSYLRDTIKTEEDVTEKLDTTLFEVVEHESLYRNYKARFKNQKKKILITEPAVSFGFVETMKKIRTKILYYSKKENCKVLFITSTGSQEGKSTIAANLALAMAQRNKKILLVEGELRNPSLAKILGIEIPQEAGLNPEAKLYTELEQGIFTIEGKNLQLLLCREPYAKSTEFLMSKKFVKLLESMKEKVDFIIIDGPAAKGRADAEVLARQADVSLLVVRQDAEKVPLINDTIDMLNRYGKGVAGCIFNDVFFRESVISSGYGYGYSSIYGKYRYGKYRYGRYGRYYRYGNYGKYGKYGKYGRYSSYYRQITEETDEAEKEE